MGRPYEYPNADARPINDPHHFCPLAKIIGLFNQANGTSRSRMSPEVEHWFETTGRARDWVEFRFSAAGCNMTADVVHARKQRAGLGKTTGRVVSLDEEARKRGR